MEDWYGAIAALILIILIILSKTYDQRKAREEKENELLGLRIFQDTIPEQHLPITDEFFTNLCIDIGVPYLEIDSPDGSAIERCDGVFQSQKVRLDYGTHRERIAAVPLILQKRKKTLFQPADDGIQRVSIKQFEVLEIRIPVKQKFWLRMNRERLKEEDAQEIQIGNATLDREYVIHTNQREAAEDFLQRFSVQKHISKFPCTFEKLEIIHGEVCLTLHEPRAWCMSPSHLAVLLKELLVVIKQYEEHQLISIQVAIAQGTSRCPYCRGEFDEASGATIRCKNCSTMLHEACWNENAQCTTWGCRSTAAI